MDVYVTSRGREPQSAWPHRRGQSRFVALDTTVPADEAAELLHVALAATDPSTPVNHASSQPPADSDAGSPHAADGIVVFAHSFLAIPALVAVTARPVDALVLVEPAFYDAARGAAVIESHIETVERACDRRDVGDLHGYWSIIRPLMFGGPLEPERWATEEAFARAFSARTLPWGHDLHLEAVASIPTLVVTGAWNDEYETIADVLVTHGAMHTVLPGYGHRAQDHPEFVSVVRRAFTT